MNEFERRKDPKEAMEIGYSKDPIYIDRIYDNHKSLNGSESVFLLNKMQNAKSRSEIKGNIILVETMSDGGDKIEIEYELKDIWGNIVKYLMDEYHIPFYNGF